MFRRSADGAGVLVFAEPALVSAPEPLLVAGLSLALDSTSRWATASPKENSTAVVAAFVAMGAARNAREYGASSRLIR